MATPLSNAGTASASTVVSQTTEVKHLADRLNVAQVKVKRLARLEALIVDFFMEIMERTASMPTSQNTPQMPADDDSAFAKAKRRDEYLKKAEGDPIALLNALRTHLRVQLTAHEQHHHEMQQAIKKLTDRGARNAQDANEELRQWEAACEKAQQQMRALAQQLTATQSDHDRTTRQYKHTLAQLNGELHTLRATSESQGEQLTKRQADVDELKRANDVLARDRKRVTDDLARTGDHLRTSSSGGSPLATACCAAATASSGLFGSTPVEQQNLKRVLQDYECKLSKLEASNDELRGEIQRQQQHLASVKQSTQAQHCAQLEKDVRKLRETLADKTKKVADQEAELLRTRGNLKERETLIHDMKDEYNKLFTAMQKIKQAPSQAPRPQLVRASSTFHIGLNRRSPSRTAITSKKALAATPAATAELLREQANENPYLLDHYKAKIEQQEKEIERLHTQLRKMIASEYRHKQKNKLFRVERVELKDACDNLRGELDRAVKTTAKAMAHHMPFIVGEDEDDDTDHSGVNVPRALKTPSLGPEADLSDDNENDEERGGGARRQRAGNQFSCTIADVRRLKQRNQYLEERFRSGAGETTANASSPPKDVNASTRPPRPSSSSSSFGSLRHCSSAVQIPALPLAAEQRSIDATTMQALQQVKHSARARPQSAGPPRAVLHAKNSSVVTKSLL